MFFAAREAVERKARERGRREERERISKILEEHGVAVSPELAKDLGLDPDSSQPRPAP